MSDSSVFASDLALSSFWHETVASSWHTSGYSTDTQFCVEVADLASGRVAVRDSKNRDGGVLVFGPGQWNAFLAGARAGQFG
jgi:hypothetical protein